MKKHPNDGSNDNPDEFSEFRKDPEADNLRIGEDLAETPQVSSRPQHRPAYGDFDHVAPQEQDASETAGINQGGAAPSTPHPEQRGDAPQNLNNEAVLTTQQQSTADQREAQKLDDPRYGSGTRNWATNEPANRSTGSEEDSSVADVEK